MDKGRNKKKPQPRLGSEEKPSDLLAHERLAHEDKDPIYPIDPIVGENPKEKKRK
jgi:hypothetical protein